MKKEERLAHCFTSSTEAFRSRGRNNQYSVPRVIADTHLLHRPIPIIPPPTPTPRKGLTKLSISHPTRDRFPALVPRHSRTPSLVRILNRLLARSINRRSQLNILDSEARRNHGERIDKSIDEVASKSCAWSHVEIPFRVQELQRTAFRRESNIGCAITQVCVNPRGKQCSSCTPKGDFSCGALPIRLPEIVPHSLCGVSLLRILAS
jgi:hypothetical protein